VAKPGQPLALGAGFPQIRWRSSLRRERIETPVVGIRIKDVLCRGRVRSADEARAHTGLSASTKIVLLLFGKDHALERLADLWGSCADEIAGGGYELVLPPSYSLWEPARAPDNLLSLRRSMLAFEDLQRRGVNTIPRVGFVEMRDAERFAAWVGVNPCVTTVTLDLTTYQARSFDRAVSLLGYFDQFTGERLRYVINGVKAARSIVDLYNAVSPERVTVTEATLARVPTVNTSEARSFVFRAAELESECTKAKHLYDEVAEGQTVDGFVAEQQRLPVGAAARNSSGSDEAARSRPRAPA
jgi:hypothetical protein